MATCGLAGSLLLTVYFVAPAIVGWPYAGGPGPAIAAYAQSHQAVFLLGAWLQVTGTMLITVQLLGLVRLADATRTLQGILAISGATLVLATVVAESTFLIAVPVAAANGDVASVSAMFTLSNGVFVRVFPLAPATLTFISLGVTLVRSDVGLKGLGYAALVLGAAFETAGIAAIVTPWGVAMGVALSVAQGGWVLLTAIELLRSHTRAPRTGPGHPVALPKVP